MKILLIEDTADKQKHVLRVAGDILGHSNFELSWAETYVDGIRRLESSQFDLLILDLLVPRSRGESPDPELGRSVVRQIASGRLNRPKYVIGLTAYEDERKEHEVEFSRQGWQLIHFDPSATEWEVNLQNFLIHVADVCSPHAAEDYDFDIAIVTALSHVELEAVLALDANWRESNRENDDGLYHTGVIQGRRSGNDLRVVACSAVRMGMPAATALSMKVIHQFRPRFIFMVGIAAGVSGNFGDVLIADQSWDYGSGKSTRKWFFRQEFQPAPEPLPLQLFLRTRLANFKNDPEIRKEISDAWTQKPGLKFDVKLGAVASGAAVLEDRTKIDMIRRGQRKLIGIEMETYGVFMAAETAPHPKPMACSIKSVCDFGDHAKSDDFQSFAAFTSANFFYRFVQEHL
jgi:nucleoside phosphorylase